MSPQSSPDAYDRSSVPTPVNSYVNPPLRGLIRSAWLAVVPLEKGTEVGRDGAGVPANQGRTWQKVCGLDELLARGREQILDKLQRGRRIAGVVQYRRAEADRFPVKGLSCVGGEMYLSVVRCQYRIAQVDLIGEQQVRQPETPSPAPVEEHRGDFTTLELREGG